MKRRKTIDKIFWTYILLFTVIFVISNINSMSQIVRDLSEFGLIGRLYGYLAVIIILILISFILNLFVIIIYFSYKVSNKRIEKDNKFILNDESKKYFRDIIYEYKPSILYFIYNSFKVNAKTMICELLMLEKTKYISIEDKINILNNDYSELNKFQKLIVKSISQKDSYRINYHKYKNLLSEYSLSYNLIEYRNDITKSKIKFIIKLVLVYILVVIIRNKIIPIIPLFQFTLAILFMLLQYLLPIIFIVSFIFYSLYLKNNPYKLTKKGIELKEKLMGLDNYIKDFTILNEKEKSELTLWNEYLIYSVMFDYNQNIYKKVFHIIVNNN